MGIIIPYMGIKAGKSNKPPAKAQGLGDALFSKSRQQVMGLLFGQPQRSFYTNEVVRHAGMGIGSTTRELDKLTAAGLLQVSSVGNQKHYQANNNSPIFAELCGIVQKTFGVADVLRVALAPLQRQIRFAFVYGSVAKAQDTASSDIDVMIVGDDLAYAEVMTHLVDAEKKLGRAVHPTLYSPDEFQQKIAAGNSFLTRVMQQPKTVLIGSTDDIGQ